jgi:tripartite ATP-independent transporter DctM subunit
MIFEDSFPLLMFPALFIALLSGYPVAFSLAGTAILFGLIGAQLELFHLTDFGFLPSRIWGIMNNFTLLAIPLFIFMGLVLQKAQIAEDLLSTFVKVFRNKRGSLAYSVIFVGALLAATTGIVGASVVTLAVLAFPSMMRHKYDESISLGTIAAVGTLGQIIPPSIVLIILGDLMMVDIGDLFLGALLPGLMLVLLYTLYIFSLTVLKPHLFPLPPEDLSSEHGARLGGILKNIAPPILLIILILGGILMGFASPTESAAAGGVGALLIASMRGRFNLKLIKNAAQETSLISGMVFMILIGAQLFAISFRGMYGDDVIMDFVKNSGWSQIEILIMINILLFGLGFFLDFLEICFIIIPILLPIIQHFEIDKLWVAIIFAINLQTSFLTPPFGFSLFYLRGSIPKGISTQSIYRGVLPFIIIQLIVLGMIAIFPSVVRWF